MNRSLVSLRAGLLAVAVLLVAIAAYWSTQGRAPRAGGDGFVAEQALQRLTRLWPSEPHPVGSAVNRRLRDQLVVELEELGLATEVQTKLVCNDAGFCAEVDNVLAWIEGGPDTVMLAAHYDSVPAGPGAADDGAGVVTVLEIARLFAQRATPPRNTLLFLLEDGEEAGLLGAKLFADHARAASVKALVNLEARGSGGASLAFETNGSGAAVGRLLAEMPKPVAGSLFSSVYALLPSSTSFGEHAHDDVLAVNLAFLDQVANYHTPNDSVARLDPRSLQHQGDAALALIEALAERDLAQPPAAAPRVWFSWLGLVLVQWPRALCFVPALFAFLVFAFLVAGELRPRRDEPTFRALAGAFSAVLSSLPVALLIALAQMAWQGTLITAYAYLAPLLLCVVVLAVVWSLVWHVNRATRETFHGVWLLWSVVALITALVFPDAAYLPTWPAVIAAFVALGLRLHPPAGDALPGWLTWTAMALPALLALSLILPLVLLLFQAIGSLAAVIAPSLFVAAILGFWPLLPPLPRPKLLYLVGIIAAGANFVLFFPLFDAQRPQPMNIAYVQAGNQAWWWIDRTMAPLPYAVTEELDAFTTESAPPLPFLGIGSTVVAETAVANLPAPTWQATPLADHATDGFQVAGVLRSQRAAGVVGMLVPPEVALRQVTCNGVPVTPRVLDAGDFPGYRMITYAGTPAEGVNLALIFDQAPQQPFHIFDLVYDLPLDLAVPLTTARGATGTPAQNGDFSMVIELIAL